MRKLLEGLVCEGLDNFIIDTRQLNDKKWGFWLGKSTEELLIYLNETWKSALENRKVVDVIYIDFQKAYNTVSHNILIYILQAMGFSGNLLMWMVSYLEDRMQFAKANGCS